MKTYTTSPLMYCRSIETQIIITNPRTLKSVITLGRWDTGANCSGINRSLANQLHLSGKTTKVSGINGSFQSSEYDVIVTIKDTDISLRCQPCLMEYSGSEDVGFLIGIDFITQGDLLISNFNRQTILSFRTPPLDDIHF